MTHIRRNLAALWLTVVYALCLVGCGDPAPSSAHQPLDKPAATTSAKAKKPVAAVVPGPLLQLYVGDLKQSTADEKLGDRFDQWLESDVKRHGASITGRAMAKKDVKRVPALFKPYLYEDLTSPYIFWREPNKLSLTLTAVNADGSFTASSIIAGVERLITGTWQKTATGRHFTGKALGGKGGQGGTFEMDYLLEQGGGPKDEQTSHLRGHWLPDGSPEAAQAFSLWGEIPATLSLSKEDIYAPSVSPMVGEPYFSKDPSLDVLQPADVENLYQTQLYIIRNFIYARHGYAFDSAPLQQLFEVQTSWYVPRSTDVTAKLTAVEIQNITLLKRYERYAAKNYPTFGRG